MARDWQTISTDIWEDAWFIAQDGDTQRVFLYLITNSRIGYTGIYELNERLMGFALGMDEEAVTDQLAKLQADNKIQFDDDQHLVWVLSRWPWCTKHNPAPSYHVTADKELQLYGDSYLVRRFRDRYPLTLPYRPTPPAPHIPGVDPPYRGSPESPSTPEGPEAPKLDSEPPISADGHGDERESHADAHASLHPPTTSHVKGKESKVKKTLSSRTDVRERDNIWDALCKAMGIDPDDNMTKTQRGRLNSAVKDLRSVDASPSEITRRAHQYRRHHPDWPLTPQALTTHWSDPELAPKKRRAVSDNGDEPEYSPDPGDDPPIDREKQLAAVKAARAAFLNKGDNDAA